MAGFCYNCITRLYPKAKPQDNDLKHDTPGDLVFDLCEQCGPGWFDWQGRKMEEEATQEATTDGGKQ